MTVPEKKKNLTRDLIKKTDPVVMKKTTLTSSLTSQTRRRSDKKIINEINIKITNTNPNATGIPGNQEHRNELQGREDFDQLDHEERRLDKLRGPENLVDMTLTQLLGPGSAIAAQNSRNFSNILTVNSVTTNEEGGSAAEERIS